MYVHVLYLVTVLYIHKYIPNTMLNEIKIKKKKDEKRKIIISNLISIIELFPCIVQNEAFVCLILLKSNIFDFLCP